MILKSGQCFSACSPAHEGGTLHTTFPKTFVNRLKRLKFLLKSKTIDHASLCAAERLKVFSNSDFHACWAVWQLIAVDVN